MISRQTIDRITSAIRVEEIVGEYVSLKRAGANLKGLSPFKDEKTPSFVVSPSKQIWKDFSTGKGGNAISFIMEIEGFSYPEALRHAAKKYGIEVEEDSRELSEEEKQAQTDKDLLYKIHEIANDFFQNALWNTEEGKTVGLAYFRERGLKSEIIKKFQLGYSPAQKNAFTAFAVDKKYSEQILEKSGLSIFPENSPEGIDRFRERVIFPIHSFSGRVLGFGGRILRNNTKTAKYLNSPETEIYHKSNILYGINQSKQAISRQDSCFLVEGYMDVVAFHQAGIENVVASSGTSLTTEQIKLIKRLTENVTILFDGDAAGVKASFRSIDMLLADGMNIRVVLFPDGDDPDSFVRKNSLEAVEEFLKTQARDFIDFKAEVLLSEAADDPIKKAEAVRNIVRSVAFVKNQLKREIFLKEISNKFEISEQSLYSELNIQQQSVDKQQSQQEQRTPETKLQVVPAEIGERINPLIILEDQLVNTMLRYGDFILTHRSENGERTEITVVEEILNHFATDGYELQTAANKKIVEELRLGLQDHEIRGGSFFLQLMDQDIQKQVADALIENEALSNWEQFNIFPPMPGNRIEQEVRDNILIHKLHFVNEIIVNITANLEEQSEADFDLYLDSLTQIDTLNKLVRILNEKLGRMPVMANSK